MPELTSSARKASALPNARALRLEAGWHGEGSISDLALDVVTHLQQFDTKRRRESLPALLTSPAVDR